MATLFRCDLCRTLFNDREEIKIMEFPYLDYHRQQFTDEAGKMRYEICVACARRIDDLMKEIKGISRVTATAYKI